MMPDQTMRRQLSGTLSQTLPVTGLSVLPVPRENARKFFGSVDSNGPKDGQYGR
jgi:hypothetical protein